MIHIDSSGHHIYNKLWCPTWAIVLKQSGAIVGAIGYGPSCECSLPAREGEPTVGYWIGKDYWNHGLCSEALQAMLSHVCSTTSIKSLISGHYTDNPSSGRVMEKCGFIATGDICFDNTLAIGNDKPIKVLRIEL